MARASTALLFIGLGFGFGIFVAGCNSCGTKPDTSGQAPAGSVSAAASASAAAASPDAAGAAVAAAGGDAGSSGKMAHCPSSVAGAKTEIKDTKDGVTVTVTSTDAAATADIRTRANFLADAVKNASPDVKHTGTGEGGGAFGRCPVVMRNTAVEAKDVPGGSEVSVKPKDAKEADWLRRESRDRLKELAEPGAETAGQGKMAHCPSALDKTKTTVKDTKDGVEVTVVSSDAKDDATTSQIRERGKALVESSKQNPTSVHHTGQGSGGGGFGRCPVVLKDTVVEGKEIPSGMTFLVKPQQNGTDAKVVADLRKEARERAANFSKP